MANFHEAVNIVLKHEGGYVYNPNDPGGETKYGISKAQYPGTDITNLTLADAKKIYYNDYWLRHNLDKLQNQKIANFALDTVVHHGKGPAILQNALVRSGVPVRIDNRLGGESIEALNTVNPDIFLKNAVDERKRYMENLIANNPALAEFKPGWFARVASFGGMGNWAIITGIFLVGGILVAFYLNRRA